MNDLGIEFASKAFMKLIKSAQGLSSLGLTYEDLRYLVSEIGCLSSYQSLMIGELPGVSVYEAQNILSESGFLGSVSDFGDSDVSYGRCVLLQSNRCWYSGCGSSTLYA